MTFTSALIVTALLTVVLSFAELLSVVVVLTLAVLLIVPVAFEGTLYVEVIVTLCAAVRVPREQGKAVVHAPLLETNVRPAGVESLTCTPVASEGPLFVTVMVYVAF